MNTESDRKTEGPIRIDLESVLRTRLGSRKVPGWIVRRLEKLICQDELNALLAYAYPNRGSLFCRSVIEHLGIKVNISGAGNLPADGRAIFVSNHPLGGLDGMALIDFIATRYGCEPLFVVNDLLMAVEPLTEVFLPVNKHGGQSRSALRGIDDALASDRPVIIFPAGLCSRRQNGKVVDLEWKKMFVQKAVEFKRDIVPLFFDAENSSSFYRWANIRKRMGIKLNVEMALLPGEIFKARGKTFTINAAPAVPWSKLPRDARQGALMIRESVYKMKNNHYEPKDN